MSGYVPIATTTEVGAVKPDNSTIDVAGDGTLSVRAQGLLPPASEGDIAYFHAGNWIVLPPGAAGDALISNGTDPGYDLQRIAMALNGVLVGTKHEIDLDNGTGHIAITAAVDLVDDEVHYNFDLSSGILGAIGGAGLVTTVDSAFGTTKCLSLWNGSSNNAPPSGWQLTAFDDSAWPAAVQAITGLGPVPTGAWSSSSPANQAERVLYRQHFSVPAGTITAATLYFSLGSTGLAGYVNGLAITPFPGAGNPSSPDPINISEFVSGGDNVIAVEAAAGNGATAPYAYVGFEFTITEGAVGSSGTSGGTLPPATEGDLLYFHAGAWVGLHVGPAGWVLASNGVDPNYVSLATVPLVAVSVSGTEIGVEADINFIPGAGTAITGVDNTGARSVDLTITAAPTSGKAIAQSGHVSITIPAGAATNTATVHFAPAFVAAPDVIVSSESALVIASAESITGTGFVARVSAATPLAPATSLTAVLHWTVGGPSLSGKFKPTLLPAYR